MGISTWGLSWKHTIIFQNPASSTPPPANTYVAEDGVTPYTTEDGTQDYVPES